MSEIIQVQDEAISYYSKTLLIVDDLLTDPEDFRVYMKLKRIAGKKDSCFPCIKTLAIQCGMSESSARRSLKRLQEPIEELGKTPLVKIKKRLDPKSKKQLSNLYILPDLELYNIQKYFIPCQADTPPLSGGHPPPVTQTPKEDNKEEDSIKRKDNVFRETLPSSAKKEEKKDFSKNLTPEQKEVFGKLMDHKPEWGPPLKANDVCAWIKKFGKDRVLEALKVYIQDCDDAIKRNDIVRSMGACIRSILNKNRKPVNKDADINIELAERKSKIHNFIELTKRYVKITATNVREEIEFNRPHCQFLQELESCIKLALIYA